MADERNHKWVRPDSREALEELAFHMEAQAFRATRRKHRYGFATSEHAILQLLGLTPHAPTQRDADEAEYLLRVLDEKAPSIATLLRTLAREHYLATTQRGKA